MKHSAVFVLCCFCSSLFAPAASAQNFSSVDSDLALLESLITDTLQNTEMQLQQLETLKQNLNESGNTITNYEITIQEQEQLLRDLQEQLNAMSETYRTQSLLSAKYERSSKFWRTFTLAAIPITAVLSGGIVYLSVMSSAKVTDTIFQDIKQSILKFVPARYIYLVLMPTDRQIKKVI